MRIADYMERRGSLVPCDLSAVFDHQTSNAMPASVGVDKEGIEFGFSISSRLDGRETYGYTAQLGHEYPPCCKLFHGDCDRIGMGKQRLAIAIIRKRRAQLQGFQSCLLGHGGGANDDIACHRQVRDSSYPSRSLIIALIGQACKAGMVLRW